MIPGVGLKSILKLLNAFGNLKHAWHASESQLRHHNLEQSLVKRLVKHRTSIDLVAEMTKVTRIQATVYPFNDEHYPASLKEIDSAPMVLYVRGALLPDDNRALAIVGTRNATKYGRDVAYDMAYALAQQDITIISGMAHGIDSAAHAGAIDAGGRTIAVLGNGVDVAYPQNHRDLGRTIIQNGALVSEFSIETRPVGKNFPRRNRILSGMALGVLVVEAPEDSGALITASYAAEQGKDVFAIPGNIYSGNSQGSNRLIQDGAKLVMDARDILDELDITYTIVSTRVRTETIAPSNDIEAQLLTHLSADSTHIDDLVRLSGLSIKEVSSTLTILELKGLVSMDGHMTYSIARQ